MNHETFQSDKIKDGVKVKINQPEEKQEDEDYFYLKKFENKIGIITECNQTKSGITNYRIEFQDEEYGYFYRDDFHLLDEAE